MPEVQLSSEAQESAAALPGVVQARVGAIVERLRHWPSVSGAKPLRGPLKGAYRIRTGAWRVLFRVDPQAGEDGIVTIFRIDNRRDVYE